MTINELRKKYLNFYATRGHKVISSASLVPDNDPTTLFTGSGMQPMVPYLLGQPHPEGKRITDSQKCLRTQDIEEVGDNRHTTFFEMLGNWSLGNYFKAEQIPWIFEFCTKELGLDPKRIYITCFRGQEDIGIPKDEESAKIWVGEYKKLGIDAPIVDFAERDGMGNGRIFYYPAEKNWWSRIGEPEKMPIGEPGGPDTEMFWDFSPTGGSPVGGGDPVFHDKSPWRDQPCHVNCDCGRFLEIANSVFMQYQKTEKGFESLPQKNVDFGGGLERLAVATIDDPDVFSIDIFQPIKEVLEKLSGKKYGKDEADTRAFRIIMDHLRSAVFLVADGAFPSNKDQGYFTRRLMRKAIRYAFKLGISEHLCEHVARSIIASYTDAYPALLNSQNEIITLMAEEEEKFKKTLERGKAEFNKVRAIIQKALDGVTRGAEDEYIKIAQIGFDLFQTHGFPLEVYLDFLSEMGTGYNERTIVKKYDNIFAGHQKISREGMEQKFHGGLADHSEMSINYHTATHLLHATLKYVLGDGVEQKGSNITPERLRFDYNYHEKPTAEQIKTVEEMINEVIKRDLPVSWEEMTISEAQERHAIGLFPDRYDARVKVYTVGVPKKPPAIDGPTYSVEICGGPHVEHTGVLKGKFKIVKDEALGAGLRRIKAILE